MRFEARVDNLGMRKFLATNLERSDDGAWRWQINLPVLTAALPVLEAAAVIGRSGDTALHAAARLYVAHGDRARAVLATTRGSWGPSAARIDALLAAPVAA